MIAISLVFVICAFAQINKINGIVIRIRFCVFLLCMLLLLRVFFLFFVFLFKINLLQNLSEFLDRFFFFFFFARKQMGFTKLSLVKQ
jgi:hypothetical protein